MSNDHIPDAREAERAVLASVLIDPDCFAEVQSVISASDFLDPCHCQIFRAMERAEAIDQVTISSSAPKGYLAEIIAELPTSLHAGYYAKEVAKASYQRRIIQLSGELAKTAYSHTGTQTELYAKAYQTLAKAQPKEGSSVINPEDHAERMMVRALRERNRGVISFGYHNLDMFTGGMHPGNLVILGARPGMGKSQLEQEVATFNTDRDKKVFICSAEMTIDEWDERQIAMECGMPIATQRSRTPNAQEEKRIMDLVGRTATRSLYFLHGGLTMGNIEHQAYLLKESKGVDLILVDYIQLLSDTVSGDSMREKVGFISRSLKRLSRDCDCPCIAASQLNRGLEAREDKRPRMSDLKEAGDLEQDADLVLLLHRPEAYDPSKEPGMAHIYVAKQRQGGKVGKIDLKWDVKASRYIDPFGGFEC
ncbi:MAG: DnaB-like helicase C-terminal domain-containing protein [Dehalococcoidia bacterium]|jgi:replicative DNA helicase